MIVEDLLCVIEYPDVERREVRFYREFGNRSVVIMESVFYVSDGDTDEYFPFGVLTFDNFVKVVNSVCRVYDCSWTCLGRYKYDPDKNICEEVRPE